MNLIQLNVIRRIRFVQVLEGVSDLSCHPSGPWSKLV